MLIITGLGKTGTSMIARFCYLIGYDLGTTSWDNREMSLCGMEHPVSMDINNSIMGKITKQTDKEIEIKIKSIKNQVIKDPRFTRRRGKIVKTWHKIRKDFKFIILNRDYSAMADRSIYTQSIPNPEKIFDKNKLIEQNKKRFDTFLNVINKLKIPYKIIIFPDFLDQYNLIYEYLHWGGLKFDYNKGELIWNQWADKSKVHF